MTAGFTRRLALALALVLLAFGLFVAALVRQVAVRAQDTGNQHLARGLAQHIVERWPALRAAGSSADDGAREALLRMLGTVNPAVQVYLLDADGSVAHYIGEPGMVRTPRVELDPVRRFLAGAALPLRGTDPMGGSPRPFSAAMFPLEPGQSRPPGYLYVVLQDAARAGAAANPPAWHGAVWIVTLAVAVALAIGALLLWRLTRPLQRLAARMHDFDISGPRQAHAITAAMAAATTAAVPAAAPGARPAKHGDDEVAAITSAFERLVERVSEQARCREAEASAHRDVMAGVAHDLRTPLTALQGHLEALARPAPAGADIPAAQRQALLDAALGQSSKVRRLTQQLFELATLQSTDDLPHREPFRLDELVSDTVQKFDPGVAGRRVALVVGQAQAAQPIVLDGDLHLIERALSNLIDNAVRHAGGSGPVQVSLHCEGPQVQVRVADGGIGLPPELARRLDAGQPVREPPRQRPGGGIGGLGLAIAQRIALLHGGRLHTLPVAGAGTVLALALPLLAPSAGSGQALRAHHAHHAHQAD